MEVWSKRWCLLYYITCYVIRQLPTCWKEDRRQAITVKNLFWWSHYLFCSRCRNKGSICESFFHVFAVCLALFQYKWRWNWFPQTSEQSSSSDPSWDFQFINTWLMGLLWKLFCLSRLIGVLAVSFIGMYFLLAAPPLQLVYDVAEPAGNNSVYIQGRRWEITCTIRWASFRSFQGRLDSCSFLWLMLPSSPIRCWIFWLLVSAWCTSGYKKSTRTPLLLLLVWLSQ